MSEIKEKSYRDCIINLCLTPQELANLEKLAAEDGLNWSDYLRVMAIYKPMTIKQLQEAAHAPRHAKQ